MFKICDGDMSRAQAVDQSQIHKLPSWAEILSNHCLFLVLKVRTFPGQSIFATSAKCFSNSRPFLKLLARQQAQKKNTLFNRGVSSQTKYWD